MKVLLTGGHSGQLYSELLRTKPADVILCERSTVGGKSLQQERFDITDASLVAEVVEREAPDWIINAAAHTAVDAAETDVEAAFRVNQLGVENLARAASSVAAQMLHISTDFVFGQGVGSPFMPDSEASPVSVYGQSKLAGERSLQQILPDNSLIIRTAWVYSSFGNNFVKTMLRLMGERPEIGVIADQIGSPTWANSLARAVWAGQKTNSSGIMHWTGAGVASWYDFAQAIYEEATALGLLQSDVLIKPLRTDQYPTPAARPAYSVMETSVTRDQLGIAPVHWREELRAMLRELV